MSTATMNTLFANTMENFARQMQNMATQATNVIKDVAAKEREIESMVPYYFNPNYEMELPTVYRFQQSNMRFYFTVKSSMNNHEVSFYPSVTTVIDKTTPFSEGLKVLLADKGYAGFRSYMNERAHYGTFLHMQIADYFRSGDTRETRSYDLDTLASKLDLYIEEHRIKFPTDSWAWELKCDLLSIKQWIDDYEVEPIAIELVGAFNEGNHRFAGAIDLICEMTIEEKGFFGEVYKTGENKGQPKETKQAKRITAIVDFKSGKSGFFESHEIQLHMYKMMAGKMGFNVDKCFNVAPKIWEGENATYHLKDQTDSVNAQKIPFLLDIFNVSWKEPKSIKIIKGTLNGTGVAGVCKMVPASDYVLGKLGYDNKIIDFQNN